MSVPKHLLEILQRLMCTYRSLFGHLTSAGPDDTRPMLLGSYTNLQTSVLDVYSYLYFSLSTTSLPYHNT